MKKLLLIAIVALSLGSCKKKETLTPAPVTCNSVSTPLQSEVRVWIQSLASTSIGKIDGELRLMNDTIMLYKRDFFSFNNPQYNFDTTFTINSANIEAKTWLVSMSNDGISDTWDNAADTQIKIWVDDTLKFWGAGTTILNQTDIK